MDQSARWQKFLSLKARWILIDNFESKFSWFYHFTFKPNISKNRDTQLDNYSVFIIKYWLTLDGCSPFFDTHAVGLGRRESSKSASIVQIAVPVVLVIVLVPLLLVAILLYRRYAWPAVMVLYNGFARCNFPDDVHKG